MKKTPKKNPISSFANSNTTVEMPKEEILTGLIEGLQHRYWAEKEVSELLPELQSHATSYELATTITAYSKILTGQLHRLVLIFDGLNERLAGLRYNKIEIQLNTAKESLKQKTGLAKDNAIISVCKQIASHTSDSYQKMQLAARKLGEKNIEKELLAALDYSKSIGTRFSEIGLADIYAQN